MLLEIRTFLISRYYGVISETQLNMNNSLQNKKGGASTPPYLNMY